MTEYRALHMNDSFDYNDNTIITYSEEDLSFKNDNLEVGVDIVLFDKKWSIFKNISGEYHRISKYDFVEELQLPYTEIDVD